MGRRTVSLGTPGGEPQAPCAVCSPSPDQSKGLWIRLEATTMAPVWVSVHLCVPL